MKADSVTSNAPADIPQNRAAGPPVRGAQGFDGALRAASSGPMPQQPTPKLLLDTPPASTSSSLIIDNPASRSSAQGAKVAAAYQQGMHNTPAAKAPMSDFQKYRDDQLLRNPGGRDYFLDRKAVIENSPEQRSFIGRIGKDISSVAGNIKNFFSNLFQGATFLYRGPDGELKEGRQKGLGKTILNFFKDMASALSLGAYHPDAQEAPKGFRERLTYASSKLKDAVLGDLIEGVPASINHMGKNLVLAGFHLVQVLPDSTIGNFDEGRKLTTSIFDNGHVLVEYITDVMPSGDAWLRVHASKLRDMQLPVLYNLKMPENQTEDTRWAYVRNTPFRKKIETIGALLGDAAAIGLIGQTTFSGNRRHTLK